MRSAIIMALSERKNFGLTVRVGGQATDAHSPSAREIDEKKKLCPFE